MKRMLVLAALTCGVGAQAGVIVYDAISGGGSGYYYPDPVLMADDTTITDMTSPIQTIYLDVYTPMDLPAVNMWVGLYGDDGAGGVGALLGSQNYLVSLISGSNSLQLDLTTPIQPTSLNIWTAWQIDDPNAGVNLSVGAVVGSSQDLFAIYDGANWGYYWFGGNPRADFMVALEAVPEPATFVALGLGALALMRRRR